MTSTHRNIVLALSGVLLLGSLLAYVSTGARAFTRFPSPELEAQQAQEAQDEDAGEDLDALFEETGVNEEHGELQDIESEFTFGLLPGGPGKASISVATFAGLALVLSGGAVLLERRARRSGSAAGGQPPVPEQAAQSQTPQDTPQGDA